ncbi:hypothetical protein IAQ61_000981 [Plenodomus lingam]|uniref:uncharacterized protein n=1 Tax=Leptosphaeria maculans TaxID=5022 RepID=UPI003321A300|nr:hypothetical protein IAQ61_000981 [Plenodomus lingam]
MYVSRPGTSTIHVEPQSHCARVSSHPHMQFTTILNTQSLRRFGALPNEECSEIIEMLNTFHNVRTIGYVSTTWCIRNISAENDDIHTYA